MRAITPFSLLAGLGACALVWLAPLTKLGLPDFAIHMIRHMTLVSIAAPLLVLGTPRLCQSLPSIPLLASFAEFVIVWTWHMPGAHDLTRNSGGWLVFEQACFLVTGLLLWASVLDPDKALAGAGALLLTSMHMTLLGALIILSPRTLYSHAAHADMVHSLEAQQLGGMIMLVIGTPIYLLAGLWRIRDVLKTPLPEPSSRNSRP
ncbi:cytochrome c oxidase assembly protein [Granulosicoccus sp. 3-233]|uniref:cytochrome c oxidase assembly protein n=1 Tax=Granulosicoccus sp. 3-233 TaxID=3417969 RepID=UPI003D359219